MNKFISTVFIFLLLHAYVYSECIQVGLLGEFKTSTSRTSCSFGKEISRGVTLGQKMYAPQLKNCYDFVEIDINNNLANIGGLINQYSKNGVKYFIGLGTAEQTLASLPYLEQTKTILLSPTATDDSILEKSKNVILLSSPNSKMADVLIEKIKRLGLKKIAIVYGSNNPYSGSMRTFLSKAIKTNHLELVYDAPIRIGRNTSLDDIDTKKIIKSDVVILPLFENDVFKVLKFFSTNGVKSKIVGTDSWGSSSPLLETLPSSIKKNILFTITQYDPNLSEVNGSKFFSLYQSLYSKAPTDLAAFSAEAVYVLDNMIQNCKNSKCDQRFSVKTTTGIAQLDKKFLSRKIFFKKL